MWDLLQLWIGQGINHILDLDAYDHLLYIIALSLPFAASQYKILAIQVTAFTLGHTLALLITANMDLPIPKEAIEIGIVLSIFLTAVYGIYFSVKKQYSPLHYLITLGVGCIHGLGFGSYFSMLNPDQGTEFVTSLFGFNLGVEIGQLIIVSVILVIVKLFTTLDVKHIWMSKVINCGIAIVSLFLLYQLISVN